MEDDGAIGSLRLLALGSQSRAQWHPDHLRSGVLTHINQFAITVREYDEAIAFYVGVLGFTLLEDTDMGNGKRWVRVAPGEAGGGGVEVLLARAVTPEQSASVGNQTGGRVFIFVRTDDFAGDYERLKGRGVEFRGPVRHEAYGTVAVFTDLYGNKWDLVEAKK